MERMQFGLKEYVELVEEIQEDIKKCLAGFNSESDGEDIYHIIYDSSSKLKGLKKNLTNLMQNIISEGERNFFIGTGITEGDGCYIDFLYFKNLLSGSLRASRQQKASIISDLISRNNNRLLGYGLIRSEQDSRLENFEENYGKILEDIINDSVFQKGLPFFLFCRDSFFGDECKIISYRVNIES